MSTTVFLDLKHFDILNDTKFQILRFSEIESRTIFRYAGDWRTKTSPSYARSYTNNPRVAPVTEKIRGNPFVYVPKKNLIESFKDHRP